MLETLAHFLNKILPSIKIEVSKYYYYCKICKCFDHQISKSAVDKIVSKLWYHFLPVGHSSARNVAHKPQEADELAMPTFQ